MKNILLSSEIKPAINYGWLIVVKILFASGMTIAVGKQVFRMFLIAY